MRKLLFLLLVFLTASLANEPVQIKLLKANYEKNRVVLEFDRKPQSSQIRTFSLPNPALKLNRTVFDIQAVLFDKEPSGRPIGAKEARLAQFDKKTVRLVLSDANPLKTALAIDEKRITITIESVENERKKPEQTAKTSAKPLIPIDMEISKIDKKIDETLFNEPKKMSPSSKNGKKRIVIDAGHGGKDPGAVGPEGLQEKDIVFNVAMMTAQALKKQGFDVHLTRDDDVFVELSNRTHYANQKNADIFISIHANAVDTKNGEAARGRGVETYFLSPARSERAKLVAQKENSADMVAMDQIAKGTFLNLLNREKIVASNKLAIDTQRNILANLRTRFKDTADGGVREAPFWVLVGAQMPSVLIEIGYITHPLESHRIADPIYQAILAKGIADGVQSYFANNGETLAQNNIGVLK